MSAWSLSRWIEQLLVIRPVGVDFGVESGHDHFHPRNALSVREQASNRLGKSVPVCLAAVRSIEEARHDHDGGQIVLEQTRMAECDGDVSELGQAGGTGLEPCPPHVLSDLLPPPLPEVGVIQDMNQRHEASVWGVATVNQYFLITSRWLRSGIEKHFVRRCGYGGTYFMETDVGSH